MIRARINGTKQETRSSNIHYFSAIDEDDDQKEYIFKMGWYTEPDNLLEELKKKKLQPENPVRITISSTEENKHNEVSEISSAQFQPYRN